jgi:hypothetical protein
MMGDLRRRRAGGDDLHELQLLVQRAYRGDAARRRPFA